MYGVTSSFSITNRAKRERFTPELEQGADPTINASLNTVELKIAMQSTLVFAASTVLTGVVRRLALSRGLVDVQMTKALALAAHRAGVRRMVYLSSIKALADRSPNGALARNFPPKPVDPYGRSKLEAERELAVISGSTGLQVVVIRPPLCMGPEALSLNNSRTGAG